MLCSSQMSVPSHVMLADTLDQACSNRASKQRKPRKRRVAASHQKSTVVCKKQKRRWATKIPKKKEKNTIHIFDINFGWGKNPNRGHYSNAVQHILANVESRRVWVEDMDRKCIGAMANRCHLGDWTALITPLPRSRVLEHLEDSLSAQDDSDWFSIIQHGSAWFIRINSVGK